MTVTLFVTDFQRETPFSCEGCAVYTDTVSPPRAYKVTGLTSAFSSSATLGTSASTSTTGLDSSDMFSLKLLACAGGLLHMRRPQEIDKCFRMSCQLVRCLEAVYDGN